MWPVLWTVVRTYAPYVTFPVAFVVGAVGYHLEWFIRGKTPQPVEEEKSILERREDRKLDEMLGKDHTQELSQPLKKPRLGECENVAFSEVTQMCGRIHSKHLQSTSHWGAKHL
uniref:Small integral membrane protein 12 n=1 Tax=Mus spicilegus TaxID=10103 RepID=A0A8C6HES4_MUSSI